MSPSPRQYGYPLHLLLRCRWGGEAGPDEGRATKATMSPRLNRSNGSVSGDTSRYSGFSAVSGSSDLRQKKGPKTKVSNHLSPHGNEQTTKARSVQSTAANNLMATSADLCQESRWEL